MDRKIESSQQSAQRARPLQSPLFQAGRPPARLILGRKGIVTPRDVLSGFSAKFLDSGFCRDWILDRIHLEGPACPFCHQVIDENLRLHRFWTGERLTCRSCGRLFTCVSETFLSGAHFDFREFVLLSLLLALRFDNSRIAEILTCSPETVRLWRHKFSALVDLARKNRNRA